MRGGDLVVLDHYTTEYRQALDHLDNWCFLLSSMLQSYSKPTLYILLLVFSATNPLASSEFLANLHGCGDLKAGGGAGCRGRDGQGRRDGWRSRAWQIDTERTGTVGPLTYPDTVRIVRASHFLLKSTSPCILLCSFQ